MKKLSLITIKSLLMACVCALFMSCEEGSVPIKFYPISKVSRLERDSVVTLMKYNNLGLSEYNVYINNVFAYSGNIQYKPSNIVCMMNGIRYDFQLANTKGVSRVESLTASMNDALLYKVQYMKFEDSEGRLTLARVDGIDREPAYIAYKYEGNKITVQERTQYYTIDLSSDDNLGYVCNVMGLTGPDLTSKYVFNPDFYFLNIYGTPINKLPLGHEVEMSEDNQRLLRVGKYLFEY